MRLTIRILVLGVGCLFTDPLITWAAEASSPLWFDLSGPWRMRDDTGRSDLGTVPLPGTEHLRTGRRMVRLQRDVVIPSGTDTSKLILTLGSVSEAYAVRLNGRKIAQVGEFNLTTPHYARPRSFPVPDRLLEPGATARLELRIFRASYSGRRYTSVLFAPDEGPYVLTSAEIAPRKVAAENSRIREKAASFGVTSACLGLSLAALLLIVWVHDRLNLAIPLLAGYLICEALARLTDAVVIFADWPVAIDQLAHLWISIGIVSIVLFAAHIAGVRSRWIVAASCLVLVIRIVQMWHWWITQGEPFSPFNEVWRQSVQWTYLFTALIALWPILRRFRTGPAGPRSELAVPLLTAAMGLSASVRLQQDQLLIVIAGYRLQIFEIASLLTAASLAWLLLRDLTAERARFSSELEAGRAVQQLLLSGGGTPAGVEAVWQPASEVGGDFWQVIPLTDSSRLIVVGDVSGKGLKAAMIVSLLTGALRNRRSESPAQLLAELNAAMQGGGGFVTCCIVRVEPDGRLTAANAGHPAPYLNGQELGLSPGLPLGVAPDAEYTEATFSFDGLLTLVSDGVIEAANASGELFGFERARAISTQSPQAIADAAKQWGQNDDITVVTVQRTGA